MNKYATGIRFLRDYSLLDLKEIDRVDVLMCRILKSGPKRVTVYPEDQYTFALDESTVKPKDIANALRDLADKIEKAGE